MQIRSHRSIHRQLPDLRRAGPQRPQRRRTRLPGQDANVGAVASRVGARGHPRCGRVLCRRHVAVQHGDGRSSPSNGASTGAGRGRSQSPHGHGHHRGVATGVRGRPRRGRRRRSSRERSPSWRRRDPRAGSCGRRWGTAEARTRRGSTCPRTTRSFGCRGCGKPRLTHPTVERQRTTNPERPEWRRSAGDASPGLGRTVRAGDRRGRNPHGQGERRVSPHNTGSLCESPPAP